MRIIYGINPVTEALKAREVTIEKVVLSRERRDRAADAVLREARSRGIRVERAGRAELDAAAGTTGHQGVVAVLKGGYRYAHLEDLIGAWKGSGSRAFFLVLDSIQDPRNMGALIRSAHAAGVHGVIIPSDRTCTITSAVVKASSGATELTRVARVVNLKRAIERLKEEGVWVVGVEAGCRENIFTSDLRRDLAIVIGSEGKGIRRLVREGCDFCVSIPMEGELTSLNAAQAGSIALFEARRQRLFS